MPRGNRASKKRETSSHKHDEDGVEIAKTDAIKTTTPTTATPGMF